MDKIVGIIKIVYALIFSDNLTYTLFLPITNWNSGPVTLTNLQVPLYMLT